MWDKNINNLKISLMGGPGRSGQTLGSCRKFNSEQKISYKHGSKNASLRSYRSKISNLDYFTHFSKYHGRYASFNKKYRNKSCRKLYYLSNEIKMIVVRSTGACSVIL